MPAAAGPPLVPATFTPRVDGQGFTWDINQNGSVNNGTNNCFSNAFAMTVNGNYFNPSSMMMTADGSELVLSGPLNSAPGLQATRRIKIDSKNAIIRYVEHVSNPTLAAVSVTITIYTQLGNQSQWLATDQGKLNPQTLAKGECGLVALQTNGQPSPLFFFASPTSKVKPSFNIRSNYNIQAMYTLTIPAGKSMSFVHGGAQRRLVGVPDRKTLKTLFKPFLAPTFLRDVPSDVRRTLVNAKSSSMYIDDDVPDLFGTPDGMRIQPGTVDTLLLGEETRLRGTAELPPLVVETRFGRLEVQASQVAGIFGGNRRGRALRIVLRDGQVLTGKVPSSTKLRFTMNNGLTMTFTFDALDRLVMRQSESDAQPAGVAALVELYSGDRLALGHDPKLKLTATTSWGPRQLGLDDIEQLYPAGENTAGYRIALKDGSRFFALFDAAEVQARTLTFGAQKLRLAEIRTLKSIDGPAATEEKDAKEIVEPHVVLVGGNVFLGQLDVDTIELVSGGIAVPVPPAQIRLLHSRAGDDGGEDRPPGTGPVFQADLWDGDLVIGSLAQSVLPIRSGDQVLHVPSGDLVDVVVPTPTVSESLRDKIAELIRDLGHPEWERRESATKELAGLGGAAKAQFNEALAESKDPEVRKRVQQLIDGLRE